MTYLEDLKCKRHKDYDGKSKPKRGCDFCWYLFWTLHDVPECFLRDPIHSLEVKEDD
jgi:hypothetical protein